MENWNHMFREFDLSQQQYNVLRILRGQKGKAINLMDIQHRMIHKSSNTTRLVEKLRLKGFVDRIQCENNRRKVEISITKKGLKLLENIDPLLKSTENELFQNIMAKEAKQISDLLDKLRG
ncbi:MAG: MarR family transcriptional regulator [Chitinophagales bacterium]|nr:MarR family transcriptional regulator [Chitinophagales bacterium]